MQMGHPFEGLPERREQDAVLSHCGRNRRMAVMLEVMIEELMGIHIPHHVVHEILKDEEIAETQPKKAKHRKWV